MISLCAGALALMTTVGPSGAPSVQGLTAETNAWHQERLARLKAEDGWLTLIGLDWLDEGPNPAGSAAGTKVTLPATAPAQLGSYTRHGKAVSFTPAKGVTVTRDGKPFTGGALKTDEVGDPDVLRIGTLQLLTLVRGDRVGVRVRDSASAVRRGFKGIDRFPVSVAWRKDAVWEPAPPGQVERIVNVLGDEEEVPLAGSAIFTHEGKTYRLEATLEDGALFFVFGDPTNRDTSYPAGRFLTAAPPKEGHVVLDFNRAYNPPCAFTSFATCPLPSKGNRLPVRVEAGEKRCGSPHG